MTRSASVVVLCGSDDFPLFFPPFLLAAARVALRFVYYGVAVGRSFVEMLSLYAQSNDSVIDCLLELWSFF